MKNDLFAKLFVLIIGMVISMGTYFISNSFFEIKESLKEIKLEINEGRAGRSLLSERISIQEERCRKVCI